MTAATTRSSRSTLFITFSVYLMLSLGYGSSARRRSSFHHVSGDEVGSDSNSLDSTGFVEEQDEVHCDKARSEKVAEAVMAFVTEKNGPTTRAQVEKQHCEQ
jgi:hypothetical protein